MSKLEIRLEARLNELRKKLDALKPKPSSIGGDLMDIGRLQGNIGALEWVLRIERGQE